MFARPLALDTFLITFTSNASQKIKIIAVSILLEGVLN
jgi:hypothetical protein